MPDGAVKRDIKSMLPAEIAAAFKDLGLPGYRAGQVFRWLGRGVTSFEEMSDLSKDLRQRLDGLFAIPSLTMPAGVGEGRHGEISLAAARR